MTVSGVSSYSSYSQTGSTGTASSGSAITADYNTFLQLLITQLRNQDPTDPVDNTEQIAQLASFSAVEQQTQTNAKLDQLLTYAGLDKASSMIGKQITSADGETTGLVQSVILTESGLVAKIGEGSYVSVVTGVEISDAQADG